MSGKSDWLTPQRLQDLAGELTCFTHGSSERGCSYAANGRVQSVTWDAGHVLARVLGTQAYQTAWRCTDDGWEPSCSCPVAPDCKHAYALACVILAEGLSPEELDSSWMADLLPASLLRRARARRPAVPAGWLPNDPALRLRLLPSLGPRAGRSRGQPLVRLRSAPTVEARLAALQDLLAGDPMLAFEARRDPFPTLVAVPDPDLRCLLVARELADVAEGPLPVELAAYLRREDLDARLRSMAGTALAARLAEWIAPREPPVRSLRLVFGFCDDFRGETAVTVEARLTSRRLNDERRSLQQLRQLEAEASRDPGVLPPEQLDLLRLLLDPLCAPDLFDPRGRFQLSVPALLRLLLSASDSPHACWSGELPAALAARAGLQPGGPVRLGAGAVEIGPALEGAADGARVVLGHRLPDGRLLGPDERLVLRASFRRSAPTLLLAHGTFWITRGEPPPPLPELFEESGGLPLADPRMRALAGPLARRFAAFRAALAPHVREVDVQPLVCLDLQDDDWLQLRAFACTALDC